jgi:hypothetical protein
MNTVQVIDLHDVEAYWRTRGLVPDRYLPGPGGDSRLASGGAERAFVERRQLPWDAPDSARAFLGELALQRGVAASTQKA